MSVHVCCRDEWYYLSAQQSSFCLQLPRCPLEGGQTESRSKELSLRIFQIHDGKGAGQVAPAGRERNESANATSLAEPISYRNQLMSSDEI